MRTRFLKLYGIDFTDVTLYDHIVPTNGKRIEEILSEILKFLSDSCDSPEVVTK